MPFGRLQRGLRIENHHLGLLRPAVVDRGQDDGHFGVFIDVRRQLSGRVEQLRSRPDRVHLLQAEKRFRIGSLHGELEFGYRHPSGTDRRSRARRQRSAQQRRGHEKQSRRSYCH